MKATCAEIAAYCEAKLTGSGDLPVRGVSTDSRTLEPGELFVALRGARHDGHDFLEQAVARGAAALLVARGAPAPGSLPRLEVSDTTVALGEIARGHRRRFAIPVVAITGSNGKTTTKELCADMLTEAGSRVRRSTGNLNNAIGLPLSLLRLESGDDVLVLELGTSGPGEIAALARIAEPTVGAITQIARAHLEGLGSLEGVARAKGELLDLLPYDGTAVLNAEDPMVVEQAKRFGGRKLWFGSKRSCDFRAERVSLEGPGIAFDMATPAGSARMSLPMPGRHLVDLALCAAACAFATRRLGAEPLEAVRRALERFRGVSGRLSLRRSGSGLTLLDDTYNANPASVAAALQTLRQIAGSGRAVAVLGDMLELGAGEAALHAEVGKEAARLCVDVLLAVGPRSKETAEAARAGGVALVCVAADAEEAARVLPEIVEPGDTVLVKGSRGMRMERALAALEGSRR